MRNSTLVYALADCLISVAPYIDVEAFEEDDPKGAEMLRSTLEFLSHDRSRLAAPELLRRAYMLTRKGATVLEFALVTAALGFMLYALALAAIASFDYALVADLARDGCRYASLHPGSDAEAYIRSRAVTLSQSSLTVAVRLTPPSTVVVGGDVKPVQGTARVTVVYWLNGVRLQADAEGTVQP